MRNFVIMTLFVLLLFACQKVEQGKVINIDNKSAFASLKDIDLDAEHPNLLVPSYSSEDEYAEVMESWTKFHKEIGHFIEVENFKWNVPDSSIQVTNKIYFDKQGRVKYFLFKVSNKNVSDTKKAAYQELLTKHLKALNIDLNRATQFAQCGKVKYVNY